MARSTRVSSADSKEPKPTIIRNFTDVIQAVDDTSGLNPTAQRKARRIELMVVIIALGGVFVDAYDFTSLGLGEIQLKTQFHLGSTSLGLLSASMAVSALFGALFGGYFVDKLGRLPMFLLDLYFFVFSAIGAAFAPNLWILIAFRLMMGLGVGLDFPVALSFVAEFVSKNRRAKFVNLSYINWYSAAIVGFISSYIAYSLGAGANLWRFAVGFGAVPAIVILFLRYKYMTESPLWAAKRGDFEAAANVLRRTRGIEVQIEPDQEVSNSFTPLSMSQTYKLLFSSTYARRTVLAGIIASAQSIEYYAVIFYLPVISQLLFGNTMLSAILGSMFFSAIGLFGSSFQAMICTRTGIRPLTLGGSILAIISLLGLAIGHGMGVLALEAVMVGVFMIGHTIGPGPQGMAYGTLSFPTAIRASGVGWTQGMLRVGSIIGFLLFPLSMAAFGFVSTFVALAIAPGIILLATLIIKWEPVGVDIELEGEQVLQSLKNSEPEVLSFPVSSSPISSDPIDLI